MIRLVFRSEIFLKIVQKQPQRNNCASTYLPGASTGATSPVRMIRSTVLSSKVPLLSAIHFCRRDAATHVPISWTVTAPMYPSCLFWNNDFRESPVPIPIGRLPSIVQMTITIRHSAPSPTCSSSVTAGSCGK